MSDRQAANGDAVTQSADTGKGPLVRPATRGDVVRLAEINIDSWRAAYEGIVPAAYLETLDQSRYEQRWTELLDGRTERMITMVAELDGRVAAYAGGGPYRTQQDADPDEDTNDWGELYAVYADPRLWGRGSGTAVHDAVLAALRARRTTTVALWVLRDNTAAQRWYRARGWQPDGATSIWSGAGVPLPEVRLVRSTNGSFGGPSSRLGPETTGA